MTPNISCVVLNLTLQQAHTITTNTHDMFMRVLTYITQVS